MFQVKFMVNEYLDKRCCFSIDFIVCFFCFDSKLFVRYLILIFHLLTFFQKKNSLYKNVINNTKVKNVFFVLKKHKS